MCIVYDAHLIAALNFFWFIFIHDNFASFYVFFQGQSISRSHLVGITSNEDFLKFAARMSRKLNLN